MKLELLLHNRLQHRTFVNKDVIASSVPFAQQKSWSLVNPIDQSVTRNVFVSIRKSGKRRVEIGDMKNVLCSGSCFKNTRPAGISIDTNPALKMHAFHQIGSGPENMLTFGLPVFEGSDFSWCSARPNRGALINFNLNGGFESVSPSRFCGHVISIHLDKLQFLASQLEISSPVESLVKKSSYWNSGKTAVLGNKISMMFRQMIVSGESVIQENSEFIDDEIGICILNELSQDAIHGEVMWGERKRLVLKRSLEILNNPESLPISVAQLSARVGTSLSTLHRTFLSEFGIPPKAYIHARVLSLVRDELGHAEPGTLISDVANRWGIWHMGQFAQDYRRMFGELPSGTLKRNH